MNETARALLEAHVRHELDRYRGDAFAELVARETAAVFEWLGGVRLNDAATREEIEGIVERYAVQFRVSGGITELMGEMAGKIFTSRASAETRLDEILAPALYEEFAKKVVALGRARRDVIHLVAQSAAYQSLVASVVQRGVMAFLFGRGDGDDGDGDGDDAPAARGGALLAALLERVPGDLLADLERRVAAGLARYLEGHAERLARTSERYLADALDERCIRCVADEIWEVVAPMRLSEAFAYISEHDLEDFVVLGYEFWLRYRKTAYFRELVRELVGHFFDKYGEESIRAIIEDMGVTSEMLATELATVAAPLCAHALASGALERAIRARLEPFYASGAVAAILQRDTR